MYLFQEYTAEEARRPRKRRRHMVTRVSSRAGTDPLPLERLVVFSPGAFLRQKTAQSQSNVDCQWGNALSLQELSPIRHRQGATSLVPG
eukprot:659338-Rhodomonas_salina.1